jgi:diaminopimelate epimerase
MIEFYKMSGSGNDFILIDNRDGSLRIPDLNTFACKVCTPKLSVGADGLIIIVPSDKADFRWLFFNADGSEAEMCGNGGRCAARFAFIKGIAPNRMSFETKAGIIDAEVNDRTVKLRLTDPKDLKVDYPVSVQGTALTMNSINTGVPHAVHYVTEIESFDVFGYGREIRYHQHYKPAGTNVNFVKVMDRKSIRTRTYERGVEGETLACGTGSVASALISAWQGHVDSPVDVLVQSGEKLRIYFEKNHQGFDKVYLEGGTTYVCRGYLNEEAFE